MKTIWKHPIEITDIQDVFMPAGSRLLSVQLQFGNWQGWFLVPDTTAPASRIIVNVVGTGNPITHHLGEYVCTGQEPSGLVWHYFAEYEEEL